ncbi:hypothetical protein MCETHM1_01692 [Flavobacteriaceae bacterium]
MTNGLYIKNENPFCNYLQIPFFSLPLALIFEIAIEIALLCYQIKSNEFFLVLQPFTKEISFSTHV